MPVLNWIGKEKVLTHHQDVPYRILEHKYKFSAEGENSNSGNKIIHGDNLEALKSLLPEYEGKIKCIYIDPPYNTGNEKWVYNDNVNHPKIKKWLGETVGKQGEDLSRHDKWLCMMYPRLKLLHKLLADDGAIFISIDENEQANLKLICDEIFGYRNCVGNFIWKARSGKGGTTNQIAIIHEFVLFYAKDKNLIEVETEKRIGKLRREQLRQWGQGDRKEDRPTMYYPIYNDDGNAIYPIRNDGTDGRWRVSRDKMEELRKEGLIEFVEKDGKYTIYRIYKEGNVTESAIDSLLINCGSASSGTIELKEIFVEKVFDTTKPTTLLLNLIELVLKSNKSAIILDSFAGSGTTAHAVMNLNKEDGGNRKFILIEMEDYAETITAERVRRVMLGYGEGSKAKPGTGGSFDYYELGLPIFKEDKNLNEEAGEDEIRKYIYYTETQQHLTRERQDENKYLLDKYNETGYYFYYEKDILTELSIDTLNIIREAAELYIVYADKCTLPQNYLSEKKIIFKKIPRDIQRF